MRRESARIVYPNLAAEMARKGLFTKDIAKELGVSAAVANNRMAGKTAFSINEAFKIRDELFPTLLVDYLFSKRPGYDLIDIFNFPQSKRNKDDAEEKGNNPDDCA